MAASFAAKVFLINNPRTPGQSPRGIPRFRSGFWKLNPRARLRCGRCRSLHARWGALVTGRHPRAKLHFGRYHSLRCATPAAWRRERERPELSRGIVPRDFGRDSLLRCARHGFCQLCNSNLSGYCWRDQRRRASAAIWEVGRAYRSGFPRSRVRKAGAALDRLGARGVVGSVGVRGGALECAASSGVWYGSHPWCRRDGPGHYCQVSRDAACRGAAARSSGWRRTSGVDRRTSARTGARMNARRYEVPRRRARAAHVRSSGAVGE
jgi:hypothetical protein